MNLALKRYRQKGKIFNIWFAHSRYANILKSIGRQRRGRLWPKHFAKMNFIVLR
jgi:hypothetical protein